METTDRMKRAVSFCNCYGMYSFKGDINNFEEVSRYLSDNLDYAKENAIESYIGDLDNRYK